jgi:hypothetical protein
MILGDKPLISEVVLSQPRRWMTWRRKDEGGGDVDGEYGGGIE